MKHTPGPWEVGVDGSLWIEPPNKAENVICDLVGREASGAFTAEDRANALLIAAAPDLLAALQQLLVALPIDMSVWRGLGLDTSDLTMARLKAIQAIARAEGK